MSYSTTQIWLAIVAAGVGTFAIRLSFIALLGRLDGMPSTLATVLRYVPAAVLAALVVPAVIALEPAGLSYEPPQVVAAVVAGLVAWRTENVLATIVAGMVVVWGFALV
ncbi:AzlD domain-containing protein [Natronomonas sp. EA1]|uniref:AzlD domain-containing protein n=1 Tax=Natronomonas sp. EA1 TaxID=3421655 RepID=UPI003EBC8E3A